MSDSLADAPTGLLAQASETLIASGYRHVDNASSFGWPTTTVRVFEDAFGVVAIAVFDTWEHLAASWPEAQAALVELLSASIAADQAKAWEGYLVLLTPGTAGAERQQLDRIRYDVSRLRKLVADATELDELGALDRLLAPLLPLAGDTGLADEPPPPLDLLRAELHARGLAAGAIDQLLAAFEEQDSLVESLDRWRRSNALG
jgi:hypothetical protein